MLKIGRYIVIDEETLENLLVCFLNEYDDGTLEYQPERDMLKRIINGNINYR